MTLQVGERARRVVVVPTDAARSMQQADVEQPLDPCRITQHQIVGDGAFQKALPVYRNRHTGQPTCLRLVGSQHARHDELARHDLVGIVVAADGDDLDLRAGQPGELLDQELAGPPVPGIAVAEVAGQQHERDLALQGEVHQPYQGLARGAADALGGGAPIQATEGAVQVDICGV